MSLLLSYLFQNGAQRRRYIRARKSDGNIRMQETDFVTAIIPRATCAHGVERDTSYQARHGIGQLYFISCAALLPVEFFEDFRRKNVPTDDAKS